MYPLMVSQIDIQIYQNYQKIKQNLQYLFQQMKPQLIGLITLSLFIGLVVTGQKDYTDFVKDLQKKITESPFKGSSYERLAYITDSFGPRMWGSNVLQQVIHQMMNYAKQEQFDNIRLQSVSNFTKWVRGAQKLTMLSPRKDNATKLAVTSLGGSVAGDVTAQVLVVDTYEQLEKQKAIAKGKIILFNNKWIDYHTSVTYRVDGPSIAAKYGAVGMLVRSVASDSIYSVHTGYMQYDPLYPKIPCAAIATQDSEMMRRMFDRGQNVTLHFSLSNQFYPNTYSNNLIFQIKGSTHPQQIILAGGHIDTWDTGSQTGANDDGGGFITVFQAFRLLKKSGYRPKRTMRFIAWSGEESGSQKDGAAQYVERHKNQMDQHVAAFQSDFGSTHLLGFGHVGVGQDIVKGVLDKYLSILGAGTYSSNGQSADVQPLYAFGVPIFNVQIEDTPDHAFYFKYHHTAGDSMTIMNADDMDSNVVGIAAFLYIIADLETTVRTVKSQERLISSFE